MGRQVNFYIGPEDLFIIEEILNKCGAHVIYSQNAEQKMVTRSDVTAVLDHPLMMWYSIFVAELDIPTPKVAGPLGNEFFDSSDLPVLEFNAHVYPAFNNDGIRLSRFYYMPAYWEGDLLRQKDPRFVAFCQGVFSRVRRRFKKSEGFWYVGPHAERMMAAGVKFN